MALSAADVGELRRRIQCDEITVGEEGGKKICRLLLVAVKSLVKPGNMTPGEARVYELLRVYDILSQKHLYDGHNKLYIDAQLGGLQSAMKNAEEAK